MRALFRKKEMYLQGIVITIVLNLTPIFWISSINPSRADGVQAPVNLGVSASDWGTIPFSGGANQKSSFNVFVPLVAGINDYRLFAYSSGDTVEVLTSSLTLVQDSFLNDWYDANGQYVSNIPTKKFILESLPAGVEYNFGIQSIDPQGISDSEITVRTAAGIPLAGVITRIRPKVESLELDYANPGDLITIFGSNLDWINRNQYGNTDGIELSTCIEYCGPDPIDDPSFAYIEIPLNEFLSQTPTEISFVLPSVLPNGVALGAIWEIIPNAWGARGSLSLTIGSSSNEELHSISVSSGPNGTVTPGTSLSISNGSTPTYTITPASGYRISTALLDENDISGNLITVSGKTKRYTFDSVTTDHTLEATFELIPTETTPTIFSVSAPLDNGPRTLTLAFDDTTIYDHNNWYALKIHNLTNTNLPDINVSIASGQYNPRINHWQIKLRGLNPSSEYEISIRSKARNSEWLDSEYAVRAGTTLDVPIVDATSSAEISLATDTSFTMSGLNLASLTENSLEQIRFTCNECSGQEFDDLGTNYFEVDSGFVTFDTNDESISFEIYPEFFLDYFDSPEIFLEHELEISLVYSGNSNNDILVIPSGKLVTFSSGVVSSVPATTHTITVTAGSNGSISPGTSASIADAATPSYTITPASGYVVDLATVDSVDISSALVTISGNIKSYTFASVTAGHTIAVTFKTQGVSVVTPPRITLARISASVLLSGGQTLYLEGTNFQNGASVTVAGNLCVVTSLTSTVITCTTPAISEFGEKSVVVTNNDGGMDTMGVLFAAPTYWVIFSSNGGSGTMNVETSTVSAALSPNTFTRTGYTFEGWASSSSGSVVYADRASYAFTSSTTLYAIWTINPPPVVYIPPPPQPYLSVGTAPAIRKVENLAVCSSGTYDYGVTYFDGTPNSLTKNVSPAVFLYKFFIDGAENKDLAVSSAAGTISIPMSKLPATGLLTCQVTVQSSGVSIIAASTLNAAGVGTADAQLKTEIEKANLVYQSTLKANADTKKSALIANRKLWRDSVQLAGTVFATSRTAAKSSKEVVAASKIQSLAVAKAAANYKQGIVLIDRDYLNMNTLAENARKDSHKNANSVFAGILETSGYGVTLE